MWLYSVLSGLNGKSPNLYLYVLNNPLTIKDPTGAIPIPVIGAIVGAGVHLLTTPPSQVSIGSKYKYVVTAVLEF